VVVDGRFAGATGTFTLRFSGEYQMGEQCDPERIATGQFACELGGRCVDGYCEQGRATAAAMGTVPAPRRASLTWR